MSEETIVMTASRSQVEWAIDIMDKAGQGEEVDEDDFWKANSILTVVSMAAFGLQNEVGRLRRVLMNIESATRLHDGILWEAMVMTLQDIARNGLKDGRE